MKILHNVLLAAFAFLFAGNIKTSAADVPDPSNKRVLILCDTVLPQNNTCWEAMTALGLGFTPDIVCAAQWNSISNATVNNISAPFPYLRFGQYWAIILGDPTCSSSSPSTLNVADASKSVWSPIIRNGNIIINGEDFSYHAGFQLGSRTFLTNAINFATAVPTNTGLFASLSCYYLGSGSSIVPALPLSQVSLFGGFTVVGQSLEKAHLVAAHPTLAGLNDPVLSNYGNSSHDTFRSWPADFVVLAMMLDGVPTNAIYTAGDGTVGAPYIMAKGKGLVPIGSGCISITNRAVDCIATNNTYQWQFCVTNSFTNGIKFLSLLDLPAGVTVSQDIVSLPTELSPGQGTCLTLFLTNASTQTNICFTVGAHSTNFALCCSITNCLAITPCCTYFSNETIVPIAGQPGCYNYSVVVRNLSTVPVKYIFFTPESPNTCPTFTPDIISLATPLAPNSQITVVTKVCMDATCPRPVCFLVSIHDTNLVQCCSVRHCISKAGPIGIANPKDGTVFYTPVDIGLTVAVTPGFSFSSVSYSADGSVVASSSAAPFSATWSNAPAGDHVLKAAGVESSGGGIWTSDPVIIYVRTDQHSGGTPEPPVLSVFRTGGDQLTFSVDTHPGTTCCIEYTDSLSPTNWKLLLAQPGDGSVMTVTDSITNAPARFYRARIY
jgi:hypothetical protein